MRTFVYKMVRPKLKCIICHIIKSQCLVLSDEFLGRCLFNIITNLCDSQVNSKIKSTDKVCAECAMELWRTDKMLTQLRSTLAEKLPNDSKIDKIEKNETLEEPILSKIDKIEKNETLEEPILNGSIQNANDYSFQCTECKYSNKNPKLLRRHLISLHKYDKNKCLKCSICAKAYSIPSAFMTHMQMHRDGKITSGRKKQLLTTFGEQTLNNAKAMSTPISTKKNAKKQINEIKNSAAEPKPAMKELATPINTDSGTTKKKTKKQSALKESATDELQPKKTKLFEKIKDDTVSLAQEENFSTPSATTEKNTKKQRALKVSAKDKLQPKKTKLFEKITDDTVSLAHEESVLKTENLATPTTEKKTKKQRALKVPAKGKLQPNETKLFDKIKDDTVSIAHEESQPNMENLATPTTEKKTKKQRALKVSVKDKLQSKETKLFEKIKDDTISLVQEENKPKMEKLATPTISKCSSIKKTKRALKESAIDELQPKKIKLFEKIKDDTVSSILDESTIKEEPAETFTCSQCEKTVSSKKKLQKHILKKHS